MQQLKQTEVSVVMILFMDLSGASSCVTVTMHSLKTSTSVKGLLCLESTQAACRDAHVTLSWSVKARVITPLAWQISVCQFFPDGALTAQGTTP